MRVPTVPPPGADDAQRSRWRCAGRAWACRRGSARPWSSGTVCGQTAGTWRTPAQVPVPVRRSPRWTWPRACATTRTCTSRTSARSSPRRTPTGSTHSLSGSAWRVSVPSGASLAPPRFSAELTARRLRASDRVDPYVAVYEPPPASVGAVTHLRWNGLMDTPFVQSVIDAAVYVSPCSSWAHVDRWDVDLS